MLSSLRKEGASFGSLVILPHTIIHIEQKFDGVTCRRGKMRQWRAENIPTPPPGLVFQGVGEKVQPALERKVRDDVLSLRAPRCKETERQSSCSTKPTESFGMTHGP